MLLFVPLSRMKKQSIGSGVKTSGMSVDVFMERAVQLISGMSSAKKIEWYL
jgi:hypothetical protein